MKFVSGVLSFLGAVFVFLGIALSILFFTHSIPAPSPQADSTIPPPNYVLVKGERWYIYGEANLDSLTSMYGYTDCDHRLIVYDKDIQNPILRETVWHELSHAQLCYRKIRTKANWTQQIDGEEHDVIYPLAMAQISFMHDNPEFMRWMLNW